MPHRNRRGLVTQFGVDGRRNDDVLKEQREKVYLANEHEITERAGIGDNKKH